MSGLFADKHEHLSVRWENDTFLNTHLSNLWFKYTDRYYTNGVYLNYMSSDNELSRVQNTDQNFLWSKSLMQFLPKLGMEIERTRGGFQLEHQMYTPAIIASCDNYYRFCNNQRFLDYIFDYGIGKDADQLQVNDRPYAAMLMSSVIHERRGNSKFLSMRSTPTVDTVIIGLGMIGPEALGEQLQSGWHQIFNGVRPEGWSNQLKSEVGLLLHADRKWRIQSSSKDSFLAHEVDTSLGVDLGNIYSQAEAGISGRLGFGLPETFYDESIDSYGTTFFGIRGFYFFASANYKWVIHNIFIAGNTYRNSHGLVHERLQYDLKSGIGARIGGSKWDVNAELYWNNQSKEFNNQVGSHSYLTLSVNLSI